MCICVFVCLPLNLLITGNDENQNQWSGTNQGLHQFLLVLFLSVLIHLVLWTIILYHSSCQLYSTILLAVLNQAGLTVMSHKNFI